MTLIETISSNAVAGILTAVMFSMNFNGLARHTSSSRNYWTSQATIIGGFFLLFILCRLWLELVTKFVPEPYLDEVFHIPQAQKYCEGKWTEWDDKITTPPGLYAVSMIYHKVTKMAECSAYILRGTNNLATMFTALVLLSTRQQAEARLPSHRIELPAPLSVYSCLTSFNIALFPVLFFFSGLYYTDVMSTLFVLVCYQCHQARITWYGPSIFTDLLTVVFGVAALCMRQTNVFWVVVYMGGMEAVYAVKILKPEAVEKPVLQTVPEMLRFYAWRYSVGDIHDPPLRLAWPDDWALSLLSIGIAAVCNPAKVARQIWPHVLIVMLFGGFVAWNGGVVLGDKSNHIATLHLAQMLYIWPLFAFFSAPLLLPLLFSIPQSLRDLVSPSSPSNDEPAQEPAAAQEDPAQESVGLKLLTLIFAEKLYHRLFLLATVGLGLAVVRYNTIVHPFTLADNRHYMFYVFRYTILRGGAVRYALVAAYVLCARLCWLLIAGAHNDTPGSKVSFVNSPFFLRAATAQGQSQLPSSEESEKESTTTTAALGPDQLQTDANSNPGPTTSTALLWLITATMSLVTAPLVEPRYFILPWVFWRLLVPGWSVPNLGGRLAWLGGGGRYDPRPVLEMAWFSAINAGTMYVFLTKPFFWRAPDGSLLDGGKVQRFMW